MAASLSITAAPGLASNAQAAPRSHSPADSDLKTASAAPLRAAPASALSFSSSAGLGSRVVSRGLSTSASLRQDARLAIHASLPFEQSNPGSAPGSGSSGSSSSATRAVINGGYVAEGRARGTSEGLLQPLGVASFSTGEETVDESEFEDEEEEDSDSEEEEGDVIHVNVDEEPKDELRVENLGIKKVLQDGLIKRGIERLFPIQEAVMKPSMAGRDIIARAKTGTGKTLAFGIPIMEKILDEIEQNGGRRAVRGPRCLVLAPTRELAKQVEREFMETLPSLATVCVYGGVSMDTQIRQIKRGLDVVVGTPGRMIDLLDRGALQLEGVQFVVLDEADQMLAVGFEEDVERIMESIPGKDERQTCLFSATMPSWVKKLSRKYLNTPLTIDLVGEKEDKLAESIKLMCVKSHRSSKRAILTDLITVHGKGAKTIVFTQTKRDADDVAESLARSLGCEALHGDIAQAQRERTLQSFREGRFPVLVATDVAARGLDIPNVDLVIHYEIPNDPETFVHRSGRTGRAGKSGSAILMYTDAQLRTLRLIERDVGCKFERVSLPTGDQVLQASADRVAESLTQVHPELADVFLPTAQRLLADKGPLALAAAIAQLSGFSKPPVGRSLLTHEEGSVTIRMLRSSRSRGPRLSSPRSVLGALADLYRPAADSVGKIRLLKNEEGAVFDLPESVAKDLLQLENTSGDTFDVPKELPAIEETEESDRGRGRGDRYGEMRGGGGGGGGRGGGRREGGGFRGGSGARGGRDEWGSGGRSGGGGKSWEDRGPPRGGDRFGSRGISSGPSGGRTSGPWSESSGGRRRSAGGDTWGAPSSSSSSEEGGSWADGGAYGARSAGRGSGGYGERSGGAGGSSRSFSGVCFLCKQPGHRASDCPVVTGN